MNVFTFNFNANMIASPVDSQVPKSTSLIRAANRFASENRLHSWFYVVSTLLLLTVLFWGTTLPIDWRFRLLLSVAASLVMARMFVLYHDFNHGAILHNSLVAKILMFSFGFFALAPVSIWKLSHDHHHNHNSKFSAIVIGSFPLMTKADFLKASTLQRFRYLAFRHPLTIALAYLPVFLISFCLYPFFETPRKHFDCLVAVCIHAGFLLFLFHLGGWAGVLFTGLIPFILVCMIGAYIFYAQHNCPGLVFRENNKWGYLEAALTSSSYIKMNRFMRWVTANIGYHHIHHVNSKIPFYRLDEAMKAMEEFQSPAETSLHPVAIYRCLTLKLWDTEKNRLITLKEL